MASIEKRQRAGQTRWYARYRDPTGRQRVKVFDRKLDAERYLTTVESAKLVGSYVDPALARLTVGEWTGRWLAGQAHLKPRRSSGTPGSCGGTCCRPGARCGSPTCRTPRCSDG